MSEGDKKPSSGPVVAEAHQVDTYHVPKGFFGSVQPTAGEESNAPC